VVEGPQGLRRPAQSTGCRGRSSLSGLPNRRAPSCGVITHPWLPATPVPRACAARRGGAGRRPRRHPPRDSNATQGTSTPRTTSPVGSCGRRPAGAADDIRAIDRGVLLLHTAGLTFVDPVPGWRLSVDQNATCPEVTAGLAITSTQNSTVSTSAEYTVRVLHRP